VEKAKAELAAVESSKPKESAAAASKRRRLEAAAAVKAQKLAAYHEAMKTGAVLHKLQPKKPRRLQS